VPPLLAAAGGSIVRRRSLHSLTLIGLFAIVATMFSALGADARQSASRENAFFAVNLNTGAFSYLGCVGLRDRVAGLALTNSVGYAVTNRNQLATFPLNNPYNITNIVTITGVDPRERFVGIDIRPLNQVLYGQGASGTVYTIDPASGVATALGPAGVRLDGRSFGFDFNPQADRIRVVSERQQNLRLNPNDGTLAAFDGTLTYAAGDVNARKRPEVEAAAYTNNVANAASTQLFVIDERTDSLALQAPPNDGVLTTIGPSGYSLSSIAGFDITPGGSAFAVARANGVRC
jgi:hypothetical protein